MMRATAEELSTVLGRLLQPCEHWQWVSRDLFSGSGTPSIYQEALHCLLYRFLSDRIFAYSLPTRSGNSLGVPGLFLAWLE